MTSVLLLLIVAFQVAEAPARGELAISSLPGGAVVWIDGIAHGVTPRQGALRVRLSEGRHQVRFTRAGYADLESSIVVRRDRRLPVKACLIPHWDHARPAGDGPALAVGQSRRGQFRIPNRRPEIARIALNEPPGSPLLLKWSTPRLAIGLRVVGRNDEVLAQVGRGSSGHIRFTMPEDGVARIEVSCLEKEDPSWLGLGGYCLTLGFDACPPDDKGKRRGPILKR